MAAGPHILIFDSGVGGLTVLREARRQLAHARLTYVADNAGFPYGAWQEDALVAHVIALFERLVGELNPDICVIACNTASTLVLPALRARFSMPFVGTVPAIKPAAERTRSGLISVLATPGTVKRDYTGALIRDFAGHCEVTLVGAANLAALAEAKLAGEKVDPGMVRAEIEPAFREMDGRRTDHVVLACTHYPLLLDELAAAAPWDVAWIDPAAAIARRIGDVLADLKPGGALARAPGDAPGGAERALFTARRELAAPLRGALLGLGLEAGNLAPGPQGGAGAPQGPAGN
ncbi:MAG TPA: glutamate racemase [Hyphomicrobiales bacterium]|nr:glutamate racemase [Rhodobiaceae bacterium]HXK53388.1 glutamate racemase [Hyphomicrobiales bacterium]